MKYFFKQYWRYIAMALAFATFNFLINACEVHAQESQIQTIQFGNWIGASANSGPTYTIYQKSVANAPLKNFGRSFLQFNVILYSTSGATDTLVPSLREVNVQSTGNMYTCNLGSVSQSYSIGTTYKANLYSILCDVNLGANGLQMVEIEVTNTQNFPFQILTSDYLTAIDNIDDNISGQIDSINSNMGTYIGNLISSQNYGNDQLEAIKSMVNTNLTTIIDKLEGINIRLDSINTNLFTYINNVISAINNGNDAIDRQTQQQHNDAQSQKESTDAINNSINNSNTDGGQTQANDFFNNFDGGQTGSLMDIVHLPLDFLDSLNNSCSPITLTLPFINQTFQLPCLRSTLTSAFGGVVSIIVLVINAVICYRLIKGFIDIIHNLKDPNNDEIEVMDL